jgi:hypothetical protein
MPECPVCAKQILDDQITVTRAGSCGVCGLDFVTDARHVEYEQTEPEKRRQAEVRRLQSIAGGSEPRSSQMTRMKGMLALLIIVCLLAYSYIANRQPKASSQPSRIEVTYRAFNQLFGPSSGLSLDEKVQEFKYWRMAPVSWRGTVSYVNVGEENDLYVTVDHASRIPSSSVLVRFEDKWRSQLEDLRVGQTLRYTGRISEFDQGTSFIALKKGTIRRVSD